MAGASRWSGWWPWLVLAVGAAAAVVAAVAGLPVLYVIGVLAAGVALMVPLWPSRARWWGTGVVMAVAAALIAVPAFLASRSVAAQIAWQGGVPSADFVAAGPLLVSPEDALVVVPADGTQILLEDPESGESLGAAGGAIEAIDPATGVVAMTSDRVYWYRWDDGPAYQPPTTIETPQGPVRHVVAMSGDRLAIAACPEDVDLPCTVTGYDRAGDEVWRLEEALVPSRPGPHSTRVRPSTELSDQLTAPATIVVTGTAPFHVHDLTTGDLVAKVRGTHGVIAGDLLVTTRSEAGPGCSVTAALGGQILWERTILADGCGRTFRSSEMLLLRGLDQLVSVDLQTGEDYTQSTREWAYPPVVGSILVTTSRADTVGIDVRTRQEVWRHDGPAEETLGLQWLALAERLHTWNPFIGSRERAEGELVTVREAATGQEQFRVRVPERVDPYRVDRYVVLDGGLATVDGGVLTVYGQPSDPRPTG